jgi:hypothetical protein
MIHTICFWNKPTINNIFFFGWLVGWFVCATNGNHYKRNTNIGPNNYKLLMQRIHKLLPFSIKGITFIRNLQHFGMQFHAHSTRLKTTLHFRIMFVIIGFFFIIRIIIVTPWAHHCHLSLSLSLSHITIGGWCVTPWPCHLHLKKKKKKVFEGKRRIMEIHSFISPCKNIIFSK